MKQSLALTGQGIARALARIAELPAVDAALRERAEQVAAKRGATRVLRRAPANYLVTATSNSALPRESGDPGTDSPRASAPSLGPRFRGEGGVGGGGAQIPNDGSGGSA